MIFMYNLRKALRFWCALLICLLNVKISMDTNFDSNIGIDREVFHFDGVHQCKSSSSDQAR